MKNRRSRPAQPGMRRRSSWRPAAAAVAVGSVLVISGVGIWASLAAEATGVSAVQSGTLKLALADTGSTGFAQTVSNLAPGDVANRYVTLSNTGTLAGRAVTMQVAASGTNALISDGATTRALRVTVANCDAAWSASGTCAAGATTLLSSVPLSALATPNAFAGVTSITAGGALNLQISVALPDQNENAVNGVVSGPSVQNGTVTLSYTFAQIQRAATSS